MSLHERRGLPPALRGCGGKGPPRPRAAPAEGAVMAAQGRLLVSWADCWSVGHSSGLVAGVYNVHVNKKHECLVHGVHLTEIGIYILKAVVKDTEDD